MRYLPIAAFSVVMILWANQTFQPMARAMAEAHSITQALSGNGCVKQESGK